MPEPLVLLPGMMCDGRLFAPQVAALAERADVTVGDITAHDSMEALADAVLAAAPKTFALGGLSMGGIVALAIVARAPQRVTRLALLDTNHRPDPPERRPVRDRQIADVQSGLLREVLIEEMKPNYLGEASARDRALLDLIARMGDDLGPEVFIRQSIALRDRPDRTEALRAFPGPTLVLCGAEDRLCTPERHREMATLAQRPTLTIVEGAGHLSTLEAPERVNAALATWLDA